MSRSFASYSSSVASPHSPSRPAVSDSRNSDVDADQDERERRRKHRREYEERSRRPSSNDRSYDRRPPRDRDYRDRDRSRDRGRYERDRSRDRESRYSPRRSRDHDTGSKVVPNSPRDRERRRSRSRSPAPRKEEDDDDDMVKYLSEEQREMRSVFVSQLAARVGDRELRIFFETKCGKVRDARVITDKISRRSKGVGYVEFVDIASVNKAIDLTNTRLLGIPIIVQFTEAEKNRQARYGMASQQSSGLYVGSLNFALTESDIRQVFQPFGHVDFVDLQKDTATGKSKGYAFVQFRHSKDAMAALEKMNNFNLAGREIKVGLVSEKMPSLAPTSNNSGGGIVTGPRDPGFDDGFSGSLNSISRIELMQKLARKVNMTPDAPAAPMMRPNIPQAQTRNVLIKNAFVAAEETDVNWDSDLKDDVRGECEGKYGPVTEIFLLKESEGEIYIRFKDTESAQKAVTGLNGRWFGGKQISAGMTTDSNFDIQRP